VALEPVAVESSAALGLLPLRARRRTAYFVQVTGSCALFASTILFHARQSSD